MTPESWCEYILFVLILLCFFLFLVYLFLSDESTYWFLMFVCLLSGKLLELIEVLLL